eukprot:UN04983
MSSNVSYNLTYGKFSRKQYCQGHAIDQTAVKSFLKQYHGTSNNSYMVSQSNGGSNYGSSHNSKAPAQHYRQTAHGKTQTVSVGPP